MVKNSSSNGKARAKRAAKTPRKPRSPRSQWTEEEDARLKRLVTAASGAGDGVSWPSIAAAIGNRSHKQCRDRWVNNLQPGVKVGDWAANEDRLILLLQKQWGNTWEEIAASLPGRTGSAVKNRCNSLWRSKERQKRAAEMEEPTIAAAKKTPKMNAAKTPKAGSANCPVAAAINFVESTGMPAEAPMKTIFPAPFNRPDPAQLEAALALKDFAISPVPVRPVAPQLARSMFSPTHTRAVMEGLASPTPTLPLAATASCLSGPFFSPIKGSKRTPQIEEASFTPLPYRRKRLSFTAALVESPSPLKCAV